MRKKNGAYKKWLQSLTPEAKYEYLRVKRKARDAVKKTKNDEWVKLGKKLQSDFRQNQSRFWTRVKSRMKGRSEAGKLCGDNGQVISDEKR